MWDPAQAQALLLRLRAGEAVPEWIIWNSKRRQADIMDACPPRIQEILRQHTGPEAVLMLTFEDMTEPEASQLVAFVSTTSYQDILEGPEAYHASRSDETRLISADAAGWGVDASAGMERYLRPRGWRRRPPRRR